MIRRPSSAGGRLGLAGRAATVGALALAAYGCLQLAAFDELGFGTSAVDGGGGGCQGASDCPPSGALCEPAQCRGGSCTIEPAPGGTDCAAEGGELCNDAGVCTVARHRWSRRFGDAALQVAHGVAIDQGGSVLVVGEMRGVVDFGGGSLHSQDLGGGDVFVLKLDGGGEHLWSHRYGDDYRQLARSVAVDGSDDLLVVGQYAGTLDFGNGPLHSALREPAGGGAGGAGGGGAAAGGGGTAPSPEPLPSNDAFVAKLHPDGAPVYSRSFGDGAEQLAAAVATDDLGNAVVVGHFEGVIEVGSTVLTSRGYSDAFVLELGPSGEPLWAKQLGAEANQRAEGVAVDGSGNVVVVGWFDGAMEVDGTRYEAESQSASDAFVVKFGTDGAVLWARTYGDAQSQRAQAVAVTENGNITVVGEMSGELELDHGVVVPSGGGGDAFVLQLDPNGDQPRAWCYGDAGRQGAYGVGLGSSGQPVITGTFGGAMEFDETHRLATSTEPDAFLAKLTAQGTAEYAYRFGAFDAQEGRAVAVAGGRVVLVGFFSGLASFGGDKLQGAGAFDLFVAQYDL